MALSILRTCSNKATFPMEEDFMDKKKDDSDPELLFWKITDPAVSLEQKRKSMDKLMGVRWLGSPPQPLGLWIYGRVRWQLDNPDAMTVEDYSADILMKAWDAVCGQKIRALQEVRERGHYFPDELTRIFTAYLGGEVRGMKKKHHGEQKRQKMCVDPEELQGQECQLRYYVMPSTQAECQDTLDSLKKQGVKDLDLEILELWVDGYTYAEIAEKLGMNEAAVKQRVYRLREKVRKTRLGNPEPSNNSLTTERLCSIKEVVRKKAPKTS